MFMHQLKKMTLPLCAARPLQAAYQRPRKPFFFAAFFWVAFLAFGFVLRLVERFADLRAGFFLRDLVAMLFLLFGK
jgi:hypothetical protein